MPKSRNRKNKQVRIEQRIAHQQQIAKLQAAANTAVKIGQQAWMVLVAVLVQQGGSATVTQGTLDQVGMNLTRLDYIVEPSTVEGEYTVRVREEQANGGEGTDTPSTHDGHDHAPGETCGSAAGSIGDDGSDARGTADPAEPVGERRSDFAIRRIGDEPVAESGD